MGDRGFYVPTDTAIRAMPDDVLADLWEDIRGAYRVADAERIRRQPKRDYHDTHPHTREGECVV